VIKIRARHEFFQKIGAGKSRMALKSLKKRRRKGLEKVRLAEIRPKNDEGEKRKSLSWKSGMK